MQQSNKTFRFYSSQVTYLLIILAHAFMTFVLKLRDWVSFIVINLQNISTPPNYTAWNTATMIHCCFFMPGGTNMTHVGALWTKILSCFETKCTSVHDLYNFRHSFVILICPLISSSYTWKLQFKLPFLLSYSLLIFAVPQI